MSDNLRNRLEVIQKDAAAIQAASKAAGKDVLDADEATQFDAKMAEFDAIEAQIKREEKSGQHPGQARHAAAPPGHRGRSSRSTRTRPGTAGSSSFASSPAPCGTSAYGKLDPRLAQNAITTYGNENVGPDGGFAVPPDFRSAIVEAWESDDNVDPAYFSPMTTNSNMVTLPADETTPTARPASPAPGSTRPGRSPPPSPCLKLVNIPVRKVWRRWYI